jgi:hypothetical protein
VIFVDQAADASLPSDAVLPKIDRFGQQDPPQIALIPDQGAVQDLAPASDVDEVSGTYTSHGARCPGCSLSVWSKS